MHQVMKAATPTNYNWAIPVGPVGPNQTRLHIMGGGTLNWRTSQLWLGWIRSRLHQLWRPTARTLDFQRNVTHASQEYSPPLPDTKEETYTVRMVYTDLFLTIAKSFV